MMGMLILFPLIAIFGSFCDPVGVLFSILFGGNGRNNNRNNRNNRRRW